MAFARLALKNFQNRVVAPPTSFLARQEHKWTSQLLRRLSSTADVEKPVTEGGNVTVDDGGKKSKLFRRRRHSRGLWRRNKSHHFVPSLSELMDSGFGHALVQATENINRLVGNLSPSHWIGRAKEHEDCYKLRFHMPGLRKEDVKISFEDGVLSIRGDRMDEEEEEGSDEDEYWCETSYGHYNTSVMLPNDVKVDEIKAEMKDGVLNIYVPKSKKLNKDAKDIPVE